MIVQKLIEALETALDWMQLSHNRCDMQNDEDCYAEQYGDGDCEQHAFLRDAWKMLEQLKELAEYTKEGGVPTLAQARREQLATALAKIPTDAERIEWLQDGLEIVCISLYDCLTTIRALKQQQPQIIDVPDYANPLTDEQARSKERRLQIVKDVKSVSLPEAVKDLTVERDGPLSTIKAQRACECSDCDVLILYGENVYLDDRMPDELFCSPEHRARSSVDTHVEPPKEDK